MAVGRLYAGFVKAKRKVTEEKHKLWSDILFVTIRVNTEAMDKSPLPDCLVFRCACI